VCEYSLSSSDQGGDPTLSQCYQVSNGIEIFQISDRNLNYALNHRCNRYNYYNCNCEQIESQNVSQSSPSIYT